MAPPCSEKIEILYEDEYMLVINKPSGLLSLSGKDPRNWDSVHYRLTQGQDGLSPKFPKAKLPHRLDFGTSGIMVVGLTKESVQHLNKQFQARTIQKRYIAMLKGWVTDDHGQITSAITKDKKDFPRVKVCHVTGKEAISEYTVIQRLEHPRRSLVQFTPHTGRTHQLRVHSQVIGHPILGCDLYNSDRSEGMANRLLLHASDLYFKHPSSGKTLHEQCPCPF